MSYDATRYPFAARLARHEWQVLLDRWQRLQPSADRFATAFFDTLFAHEPEFVQLFDSASLEAQFLLFAHVLSEIVTVADDADELARCIELVVQRLAKEDGAADQSRAVRAAIAATLAEVAKSDLTPHMRASWHAAYVAVTAIVRSATLQADGASAATILRTAVRAELAADRLSPSVARIMESSEDSRAA